MKKKKRALALGLAATQLSALTAIVAPVTAYAAATAFTGYSVAATVKGGSELTVAADGTIDFSTAGLTAGSSSITITVTPDAGKAIKTVSVGEASVTLTDGSYEYEYTTENQSVTSIKVEATVVPELAKTATADEVELTKAAPDSGNASDYTLETADTDKLIEAAVAAIKDTNDAAVVGLTKDDFTVDASSNIALNGTTNYDVTLTLKTTDAYAVEDGGTITVTVPFKYKAAPVGDTVINAVAFTVTGLASAKPGDALAVTLGSANYTATIQNNYNGKDGSEDSTFVVGENRLTVVITPADGYKFDDSEGATAPEVTDWTGTILKPADGKANAIYQRVVDIAADPVAAEVDTSVTFDTVENEEEKLVDDAKTALEKKLSSLIKFKKTDNSYLTLDYTDDYTVTVGEGELDSTSKDKVTFPLTVELTAAGQKKTLFASEAISATVNVEVPVTIVNVASLNVTKEAESHLSFELKDSTGAAWGDKKVKAGDQVTLVVTPDQGYEIKSALTVTMGDPSAGVGAGSNTNGVWSYVLTIQTIANGTESIAVNIAGAATEIPTATVTADTDGLDGVENAKVELLDSKGAALGTTALKEGDKFTVKITPDANYEILTAPEYQLTNDAAATPLEKQSDGSYSKQITITDAHLTTAGPNALTLTLTGEVTKKPVIENVTAGKGIETPGSMGSDPNLVTYQYNLKNDLYSFELTEKAGAADTYVLAISAQYGAMHGKTAAGNDGKNVLAVLTMDKAANLVVNQTKPSTSTDAKWVNEGHLFVETPDTTNKSYATLWISLTDNRIAGNEKVAFELVNGTAKKTIEVTFKDTTTYTFVKDDGFTEDDYTVTLGAVDANGKAKVTVTPKPEKFIQSGGTIKYADNSTVTLQPVTGGAYEAVVDVKKFLTNTDIECGNTAAKFANSNLSVTAKTQSSIKPSDIFAATNNAPSSMTGDDAGLKRYQDNLVLYKDNVEFSGTTATVKVPAALMDGTATHDSTGANLCLVMQLDTAVANDAFDGGQVNTEDVDDGYKFVDGEPSADARKYVALWINADETEFANGRKIVTYNDKVGNPVVTINLVQIPVLKKSTVTGITAVDLDKETDALNKAAVEEAVTDFLDGQGIDTSLVTVTAGDLPDATGKVEVTIATTDDTALVLSADGKTKAASFTVEVDVTVPTYTITSGAATGGSFTVKVGATDNATAAKAGAEVIVTATADDAEHDVDTVTYTYTPAGTAEATTGTATKNENGTYSFTMPAANVTVNVTFKETFDVTVTSATNGTVTAAPTKAAEGAEVTLTITPGTGYKLGELKVKKADGTEVSVTNNKFTMPAADVTVTATFVKADKAQTAPAAPTYKSRSNTYITLNTIAPNANGAPAEYSKDGKTWQSSPKFDDLTKNTSYTFYARYAAIDGFAASPASEGTVIKTNNTSSSSGSSGGSSGGSSWRPSSGGSSGGSSSSSGSSPVDSSSSTTPNITNDTADDISDVIDTTPTAANLSKITDTAEDVEKALKAISKPSVIEKQAATVLEAAIKEAKAAVTTADKAACAENIQLIMKALNTKAPKVRGDADNSGKVDSADVLLSVLNFRKYRTNVAGQLYSAVVAGITDKTSINTNDILAFIKAFRTR